MLNADIPKSCMQLSGRHCRTLTIVVTDSFDQTQVISFYRPFRYRLAEAGNAVLFISAWELDQMRQRYGSVKQLFESLFRGRNIVAVIMSRYTGPWWSEVLDVAAARSIPSIVHLDDNLLEVPVQLPEAHQIYNEPGRLTALKSSIQNANAAYTSTKTLAEQLQVYLPKKIFHGEIYCSVLPKEIMSSSRIHSTEVKIGYMASRSHKHDLEFILPEIIAILRKYANVVFELMGFEIKDERLERYSERVRFVPHVGTYDEFRAQLYFNDWDIGLAPLRPIRYNYCKANTKWVEYTCAGTTVVGAQCPPYSELPNNVIALARGGHWAREISRLIADPDRRIAQQSAARLFIEEHLTVAKHADQLREIFLRVGAQLAGGHS